SPEVSGVDVADAAASEEWLRDDLELDRLRKVVAEEIEAALMSLSEEARTVVLLDLEDLSEVEMAAVLECPVGTVKSRLARPRVATATMVNEAIADHLRIAQAQRPLEIESGDGHRVRPWFEGRLDFSPVLPFVGDREVPLRGGALAWFLDRRAAAFVYGLRLH